MLPLTGVPLPFISYGNSNLIVLLAGMGILINVAHEGGRAAARKPTLRVVEGKGRGLGPRRYKANGCQES